MSRENINQPPVISDGHLEGLFSLANVLRFLVITPSSTTEIRAKASPFGATIVNEIGMIDGTLSTFTDNPWIVNVSIVRTEKKMARPKKSVLFVSLTLSLVAIAWTLIRTAQKHDAWIRGKLSEEFAEDARFDKVHFTVGAGSVSLKGSVTVLEDKRQAARRARAVDHVRTVTNDITVETRRIPDGILRIQLKHDLRKQGLNGLKLKVRGGVVTVRGTVSSNREQVWTLVAGTEGVRGIRDRTMALE